MHPAVPICFVFIGCASNVIFLELLIKEAPGSGNIITFFQFLFIAIEGFIRTVNFGRKRSVIPITTYLVMVSLFFLVSVVNNWSFSFNIPVPLHIIFRSGSLMANLVLGMILLHKRYKLSKYISVVMISIGITIATIASASDVKHMHDGELSAAEDAGYYEYFRLLIGIAMLTFALFMSARMGIYQEVVYTKYGKHPAEALFYNHALPLPFFLFFATDIYYHIDLFNHSALMIVPYVELAIPKMWVFLLCNLLTQYICIKSVFVLTTECTSLTVTLVVTLRKFFSLLVSIAYFDNPFTAHHWFGTALVFCGTLLFADVFTNLSSLFKALRPTKSLVSDGGTKTKSMKKVQ